MKIKNISIYHLKIKRKLPLKPYPTFFKEGFVFIMLNTDNDIYGYGEPSPYIASPQKMVKSFEKIFNEHFRNKNLHKIDLLKLKKEIKKKEQKFILPSFDQAILDIKAKEKNISVAKLINKGHIKNNLISFYASGGMIFENQKYEDLIDEALKFKNKGYVGYKFRPMMPTSNLTHSERFKNPPGFDIKKISNFARLLRKNVGDSFKLMIDFGCRCKKTKEIQYLFDALYDLNFFFIEEPFKRSIKNYQKKSFISKISMAMGEHFNDYNTFLTWKKKNLIDYYQPDSNLLLFDELKLISKKVDKKKLVIHNWCNQINFCSNLNFAVSLKKPLLIEKNILKNPYHELFKVYNFNIDRGNLKFKNHSGLGVEFIKNKSTYLDVYEKKI